MFKAGRGYIKSISSFLYSIAESGHTRNASFDIVDASIAENAIVDEYREELGDEVLARHAYAVLTSIDKSLDSPQDVFNKYATQTEMDDEDQRPIVEFLQHRNLDVLTENDRLIRDAKIIQLASLVKQGKDGPSSPVLACSTNGYNFYAMPGPFFILEKTRTREAWIVNTLPKGKGEGLFYQGVANPSVNEAADKINSQLSARGRVAAITQAATPIVRGNELIIKGEKTKYTIDFQTTPPTINQAMERLAYGEDSGIKQGDKVKVIRGVKEYAGTVRNVTIVNPGTPDAVKRYTVTCKEGGDIREFDVTADQIVLVSRGAAKTAAQEHYTEDEVESIVKKEKKDWSWEDVAYDAEDVQEGMNVEREHTKGENATIKTDKDVLETALTHLDECDDYYDDLEEMEEDEKEEEENEKKEKQDGKKEKDDGKKEKENVKESMMVEAGVLDNIKHRFEEITNKIDDIYQNSILGRGDDAINDTIDAVRDKLLSLSADAKKCCADIDNYEAKGILKTIQDAIVWFDANTFKLYQEPTKTPPIELTKVTSDEINQYIKNTPGKPVYENKSQKEGALTTRNAAAAAPDDDPLPIIECIETVKLLKPESLDEGAIRVLLDEFKRLYQEFMERHNIAEARPQSISPHDIENITNRLRTDGPLLEQFCQVFTKKLAEANKMSPERYRTQLSILQSMNQSILRQYRDSIASTEFTPINPEKLDKQLYPGNNARNGAITTREPNYASGPKDSRSYSDMLNAAECDEHALTTRQAQEMAPPEPAPEPTSAPEAAPDPTSEPSEEQAPQEAPKAEPQSERMTQVLDNVEGLKRQIDDTAHSIYRVRLDTDHSREILKKVIDEIANGIATATADSVIQAYDPELLNAGGTRRDSSGKFKS